MTKKILVTGGCGMIGSNLVRRLVSMGEDVYVIDNLERGKIKYLENDANADYIIDIRSNFFELDLMVPGVIESLNIDFDIVFHLADVVAGIGYVFNNQLDIFRQNIIINSNVVNSMRAIRPAGYIYVGTACSFPLHLQGGYSASKLVESDQYPANPESSYGWSKLMGEYEAFLLEKEFGIPVSVLTLHNVYGTPCDFSKEKSQVIPALINRAINFPDEDFIVWGSGKQGRAFVHVNDVIDALIQTSQFGLGHGLIQIGPNECSTISEIAKAVINISQKPIQAKYDLSKPEGDHSRCADFSKAKKLLNWSPKVSLHEGLLDLYMWIEKKRINE